MNDTNQVLQTEDLSIGFKEKKKAGNIIFDKISVSAGKAELVALFGPNGIGKSTLLRSLVKLQSPLSGEIFLFNVNIRRYSRTRLARKLGYVSTETVHINNLRVHDLVSLGRYPHTGWMGRLGKEDIEKVNDAINMVSIEHLQDKFIHQLSDGERQRTMIARTLAQDTSIIVLDEPTAFLDLPNKYEVVHLLQKLARKSGKTIIFSTHDLNIAIQEAAKIWLMLEGQIIQGSPEDLILGGSFSKMFKHTNLKFNENMGEFRIRRKPGMTIGLSGPQTECKWTRNALERIGYRVTDQGIHEIMVIVENDRGKRVWEIILRGGKMHFTSIYNLCRFLEGYRDSSSPPESGHNGFSGNST